MVGVPTKFLLARCAAQCGAGSGEAVSAKGPHCVMCHGEWARRAKYSLRTRKSSQRRSGIGWSLNIGDLPTPQRVDQFHALLGGDVEVVEANQAVLVDDDGPRRAASLVGLHDA